MSVYSIWIFFLFLYLTFFYLFSLIFVIVVSDMVSVRPREVSLFLSVLFFQIILFFIFLHLFFFFRSRSSVRSYTRSFLVYFSQYLYLIMLFPLFYITHSHNIYSNRISWMNNLIGIRVWTRHCLSASQQVETKRMQMHSYSYSLPDEWQLEGAKEAVARAGRKGRRGMRSQT